MYHDKSSCFRRAVQVVKDLRKKVLHIKNKDKPSSQEVRAALEDINMQHDTYLQGWTTVGVHKDGSRQQTGCGRDGESQVVQNYRQFTELQEMTADVKNKNVEGDRRL